MANTKACLQDLAKYKIGDEMFYTGFNRGEVEMHQDDEWMFFDEVHPSVIWKRKRARCDWLGDRQLPRMHADDFERLMDLMSSSLDIIPFVVTNISRCQHTGEMLYCDEEENWMPESCLFASKAAAIRERSRVVAMISSWTKHLG